MVIFGAGASYDSLARYPPESGSAMEWRPPLADQLFDARFGPYIQQFRQMHAVVPDLQNPVGGVEAVLERFQSEAPTYPRRLNQLAAVRYYLQSMLSNCQRNWENYTRGVTNYKALLDRIDHRVKGVKILVSFNYDTLLEDALESTVGLKIDGMSRYLSSDYLVAKLHGSINWIHRIKGPAIELSGMETDIASRAIDKASQLDVNPPIDLAPHFPLARWGNDAIIPALSVPVATKSVYECPPEQQQALLEGLPDVDRVLMIGWKAREKRLLESMAELMKKNLRIMIVSSSEGKASELVIRLQGDLGPAGMLAHYTVGKRGFSHAITSHEADEFLKST